MLVSLIGYRGTGKSTVGQLLAERLGWQCIDSDDEVERLAGRSIRHLFQAEGEGTFRDYETHVIRELSRRHKVVLALGGGAVLREENRRAISVAGPVVWLTAPAEILYERIYQDPRSIEQRPNLTQRGGLREIEQVLASRLDLYRACADCEISTVEKPPRELVDEIIVALDLRPQTPLS